MRSRSRSRWIRITSGTLAVALGASLGFAAVTVFAPARLREVAELALEAHLGPVEVASARATLAWGPAFELRGVETSGAPDDPGLRARSVTVTLGLRTFLGGRVAVRRIALEGLELRAARDRSGAWSPAFLSEALGARAELAGADAAPPRIVADGARVEISDAGQPDPLRIEDLRLRIAPTRLEDGLVLRAGGRLLGGDEPRGRFDLSAQLKEAGPAEVEIALSHLDTAALLPWVTPDLAVDGRASGYLRWHRDRGPAEIAAELVWLDPSWRGEAGDWTPLADPASSSVRLVAEGRLTGSRVALSRLEVTSGAFRLSGDAVATRPLSRRSVLALDLRAGPLPAPAVVERLALPLEWLEAGTLQQLRLRAGGASLADWQALLEAPFEAWPEGFALEAQLADLAVDLGESESILIPHTTVELDGARARLRCAGARLRGEALPTLHVELANPGGWLRAIGGEAPRPVPPLPGWFALRDWMEAQRKPGRPSKWTRIEVDADWLHHPALLRTVEAADFTLTPAGEGHILLTLTRGRFGGVPVRGAGLLGPAEVDLQLLAEDIASTGPVPESPRATDPGVWFRARFDAAVRALGKARAERVSGTLRAGGQHVDVTGAEARLDPRGRVAGNLHVDLTRRDAVPYTVRLQLVDGSVPDLMRDLELSEGEDVTGDVVAAANLSGRAEAHRSLLADLTGPMSLHARHGVIRQRMPMIMAVAAVSDTFNPFQSREVLEYGAIDAELVFDGGVLRSDSVSLEGPSIRMVATGSIELLEEPRQVEAVLGLFFFRGLDRVLGKLPVLNTFLLGEDENLVSAYFAIDGSWSGPDARLIPTKSLAAGPASFVLEGVPNFVRSGLGQLGRLFGGSRSDDGAGADAGRAVVGSDPGAAPPPPAPGGAPGAMP